ncbi:MAG TPA: SLC13 family permease [Vicinamibacterales bacterium]|jgi:Na+/H+ antiporter NhaD/arsenite permease-like protein|nr:SLC13 family permease [Vicinamibacterales bacterium]
MSAAIASLVALLAAIVISMVSRINVGLIAIAAAWLIGVYIAGLKPDVVLGGFPSALFLTLVGVTLLFALADINRTLEALAARAFRAVGGSVRLLPLAFFVLAFIFSAVGPGAIAAVALVMPLAAALALRSGTSPLLTALMVANGANAGNLSPISAVGIIVNSKMAEAGMPPHEWKVMIANLLAHALAAGAVYAVFMLRTPAVASQKTTSGTPVTLPRLDAAQTQTMIVLAVWVVGVVGLKLHVGLSAFVAALILIALRASDESTALKRMPWGIMLMVTGVSVLIAILEKSGGMDLFTGLLAAIATPRTVNGMIAFVTGAISTYSSTSGVVLPAFIPTAPSLVQKVGGGDPLAVALSIGVGSSVVDVSPLSTLGALCVAAIADPAESRRLFNQLLAWGLSMIVVGALLCQLFAGALARF